MTNIAQIEPLLLIAQETLRELNSRLNGAQSASSSTSAPTSDEVYALRTQAEDLQSYLDIYNDFKLARELSQQTDAASLMAMEETHLTLLQLISENLRVLREGLAIVIEVKPLPSIVQVQYRSPSPPSIAGSSTGPGTANLDPVLGFPTLDPPSPTWRVYDEDEETGSLDGITSPFNSRPTSPHQSYDYRDDSRITSSKGKASVTDQSLSLGFQADQDEDQGQDLSLSSNESESDGAEIQPMPAMQIYLDPCIACSNPYVTGANSMVAPCGHTYCFNCLGDYLESCLHVESIFPGRCCQQSFSIEQIDIHFVWHDIDNDDLYAKFNEKLREYRTNEANRVYCPSSTCSRFIGSSTDTTLVWRCPDCKINICRQCKLQSHAGSPCNPFTKEDLEFVMYSKDQGWQGCTGCGAMIERTQGCPHIVCRCRREFCYNCGMAWSGHPGQCT